MDGESNCLLIMIPLLRLYSSSFKDFLHGVFSHQGFNPKFSVVQVLSKFMEQMCILPFLSSCFLILATQPSFFYFPKSFKLFLLFIVLTPFKVVSFFACLNIPISLKEDQF